MMLGLITLFARLGLAAPLRKPLAYLATGLLVIALLWLLWAIWLHVHDARVVERHEEKITKQVEAVSSQAAASAGAAVDQSRNEVEKSNAQARAAASDSPDPLRAGLERLRQGKGAPGSSPR